MIIDFGPLWLYTVADHTSMYFQLPHAFLWQVLLPALIALCYYHGITVVRAAYVRGDTVNRSFLFPFAPFIVLLSPVWVPFRWVAMLLLRGCK